MQDRTTKLSIKTDVINRNTPEMLTKTGSGWQNVTLSIAQLIDHIQSGFPITHQFAGGRRVKDNFLQTDLLIADIDEGLSLEEAKAHPFIQQFATFIHTTSRHSPGHHRFRVVFVLERSVFDAESYEAMYESLMAILPTDPATKAASQFFFGAKDAEIIWLGNTLTDREINQLIQNGMSQRHAHKTPPVVESITPDTLVKVKNVGLRPINTLAANTSIHCPFGTHRDKNPSAFIKISQKGSYGVECRSCGHSAWTETNKSPADHFNEFDLIVQRYHGQKNGHFEYQGLAAYDHALETSIGTSNFHILKTKHFKIPEILPGIHLIKSAKGTGKTHALKELVHAFKTPSMRTKLGLEKIDPFNNRSQRTILIGHRQTLIRESAANLGLECYLDTGNFDTKIIREHTPNNTLKRSYSQKPQHYAICLDSLHSRIRLDQESYGVVIIDESEQVFAHFLSEHMKHPTSNFDALSKIIKQAKYVYCLDADLGQITMTGIIACLSYDKDRLGPNTAPSERHYQQLYGYLNTYKAPTREIEVFTSKNHLSADLHQSIRQGKRCFVTSNSKKFVSGLHKSFSKVYPDLKFQLVISDEGDDDQIRAFLKEIKGEILKVNAVFCSPSIGTGVDITFPAENVEIDVVYGFFETGINTHFDIDQQLARVRHPGAVRVWVSPKRNRYTTNPHKIAREYLDSDEISGLTYYLDNLGVHAKAGQHPFIDLIATITAYRRRSINNLRQNFLQHKNDTGWRVIQIDHNEVLAKKGAVINKASKKTRQKALKERLLNAPDLNLETVTRLTEIREKNQPLTDHQKASLEKYWLSKFYHQEVTEDLIDFDNDGKTRDAIRRFEWVTDKRLPYTNHKETEDLLPLTQSGLKLTLDQLKQVVFLREAFNHAGIYDLNTFQFDLTITYNTNSLKNFIVFLTAHKERFQHLFDKPINEHLEERPVSQLASLLRQVGLKQGQITRNRGGKLGDATYQIESKSYNLLNQLVKSRQDSRK